jgi:hypothetical protein
MKTDKVIAAIIHEVNIAHHIHCNAQARFHIDKQCRILRNDSEKKWNELGIWMRENPYASVDEIHVIRAELNLGGSIRGVRIKEGKLVKI